VKFLLDTNIISEIRKRDRAHPHVTRRGGQQMLMPADDVGVRAATPYPATDSPLAETRLTEVAFQWFSNSGT